MEKLVFLMCLLSVAYSASIGFGSIQTNRPGGHMEIYRALFASPQYRLFSVRSRNVILKDYPDYYSDTSSDDSDSSFDIGDLYDEMIETRCQVTLPTPYGLIIVSTCGEDNEDYVAEDVGSTAPALDPVSSDESYHPDDSGEVSSLLSDTEEESHFGESQDAQEEGNSIQNNDNVEPQENVDEVVGAVTEEKSEKENFISFDDENEIVLEKEDSENVILNEILDNSIDGAGNRLFDTR